MLAAAPDDLSRRIAAALGLDRCRSVTLTLRVNDLATITVEQFVTVEQMGRLAEVLETNEYVVVRRDGGEAMGTLKRKLIEEAEPKEEPPNDSEVRDLLARVYGGGDDAVKAVGEFMTHRAAILDSITRTFAEHAWIPVSERIPPHFTRVLAFVACPLHEHHNAIGFVGSLGLWSLDELHEDGAEVTHWMPFPAGPTDAK
jgi:hypothetical protein